jgi:hypothetical protein
MEVAIGLGIGGGILLLGLFAWGIGVLLFNREIGVYGNAYMNRRALTSRSGPMINGLEKIYSPYLVEESQPYPGAIYGGTNFTRGMYIIKQRKGKQSRRSKRV